MTTLAHAPKSTTRHSAVALASPKRVRTPAPDRTPPAPARKPSRDLFVDALRALATLAILTVHWSMAEATWTDEVLTTGNALAHGFGWVVTWPLQVLAVLFFAAGAAAAYDSRAGRTGAVALLRARIGRILWPVVVFGVGCGGALAGLAAAGVPGQALVTLARLAPQPLWFLAVYVALLAVTPLLKRCLRALGWRLPVALVAAVGCTDLLRFGLDIQWPAMTNIVIAWAVPYTLGLVYAEAIRQGSLPRPAVLTCAGVAALLGAGALVIFGSYPASLIGMPGAKISNLGPPTMLVVLHGVGLVALALAARGRLVRWAEGSGKPMIRTISQRSMTIYVWHVMAMVTVVGIVLVLLGERLPDAWSVDWWVTRPLWFGAFALVLTGICTIVPERAPWGARCRAGRGRGDLLPVLPTPRRTKADNALDHSSALAPRRTVNLLVAVSRTPAERK